jgi:hypothetical protein
LEGGRIVAEGAATVQSPELAIGSHVFVLVDTHDEARGMKWHAVGYDAERTSGFPEPDDDLLKRLRVETGVLEAMKSRMHPGMVLIMTDLPAQPDTRSGSDFVVMTAEAS